MTSAFRTTALAAALVAFSWGASAAPVTISLDFDKLGADAIDAKAPIPVSVVDGVYFQGAWAYEWNMLKPSDPSVADGNEGGFLINRDRNPTTTFDIVVSLEELTVAAAKAAGATTYPGQFFKSITFSLFTGGAKPTLSYTDANNEQKSRNLTPGDGDLLWSDGNTYTFDALDQIRTLVFSGSQGAVLGLDNLQITLTDAIPGGGNVPEPASYALVGLALLAAGSARRRRT